MQASSSLRHNPLAAVPMAPLPSQLARHATDQAAAASSVAPRSYSMGCMLSPGAAIF